MRDEPPASIPPADPPAGGLRPPNDVADWIATARAGSNETLGKLFEHCRGYLLAVARDEMDIALREKSRPSSVVQQTLMTAQQIFERFEGNSESELLAWLVGILKNHIADLSKYFHREKRHMGRELSLERDLTVNRGALPAVERMSPADALMRDEEAQVLVSTMTRLPADYREVITLRNFECLSFDEVGRHMQRSAEAARKLWTRAIEALRREMDESDGRDGGPR